MESKNGKIKFNDLSVFLTDSDSESGGIQQHLLQGVYPMASASDFVTWRALAGFILPQLGMLWYFSPVAGIQTIAPEESDGCSDGTEEASEEGEDTSEETSPEE